MSGLAITEEEKKGCQDARKFWKTSSRNETRCLQKLKKKRGRKKTQNK